MLQSMTGYGRAETETPSGRWVVEAKSVNHRYLDVKSKLPVELFGLDIQLQRSVQERFSRGRFEILVSRQSFGGGSAVNRQAVFHYLDELRDLRRELDIEGPITIDTLLALPGVVGEETGASRDADAKAILEALDVALAALAEMRKQEGEALVVDMRQRVESIRDVVGEIEADLERVNRALAERTRTRIEELLEGASVEKQRLEQEIAFLADRSDVTEEIVRLGVHIKQFLAFMQAAEPVGRKLDFLLQEINREVNTIGSKIGDADVAARVVQLKSELEKVREQAQNVE